VLLRVVQIGTLYKLLGVTISDGCNNSIVLYMGVEEGKNSTFFGEETMLWHQRLGHIGEKGFHVLHGKGMVEGMSNFSLDFNFCEYCLYGKQNRIKFLSNATRAGGLL
jgi:hypothetical protein